MRDQSKTKSELIRELKALRKRSTRLRSVELKYDRAKRALRECESRYRAVVDNSEDAILLTAPDGRVLSANPAACRMFRMRETQMYRLGRTGVIDPTDPKLPLALAERERTGKFKGELTLLRRGREQFRAELTSAVFKDREGRARTSMVIRDITQQTRARDALRESEEQYRTLVEAAPDVVYTISREDGTITSLNLAFERLTGWSRAEWLGKPFAGIVHPDDQSLATATFEKCCQGESQPPYELRILSKTGEYLIGEFTSTPYLKSGKIVGELGIARNITERRRAEESVKLLVHTVRCIGECVSVTDADNKILFVNDAFLRTYGYAANELIGKPISIVRSSNTKPAANTILTATVQGGWQGELVNRRKDGTEFPIALSTSVVRNETGQPIALVGIAEDISERKRVEEALTRERYLLTTLMDHIPDHIYFKDSQSRFIRINRSHAKEFGLSEPAEAVGKTDFDFFAEEHARAALKDEQKIIQTGEPLVGVEERQTWTGRPDTWVSTTKMPLRDENGNVVGTFGISRDITERKCAEELLRASTERQSLILRTLPMAFYTARASVDQGTTWISEQVEQITGYAPREFIEDSMFWSKRLHPDERERVLREYDLVFERRSVALEYRWRCADGQYRWFSDHTVLMRDKLGEPITVIGIWLDITERRRAEEALRLEKENFRRSLDESPLGVRIVTADGDTLYANRAILDFYGYDSLEELRKTPLTARYTPESYAEFQKRKQQRELGDFSTSEYDISIIRRNGEVRYLQVHRKQVLWDGAKQFLVIYQDITERKKAEEALQESEERFRMVFENVFDGISIYDEDPDLSKRVLVACNERYAAMAGRSREELLKLGITQALQKSLEASANNARVQALSSMTAYRGSFSWIRPDGKDNIVEYVGVPITWHGKLHSIGIDRDITEQKRAEETLRESEARYRELAESISEVFFAMDKDLRYTYWNRASEELLGISAQDAVGKSLYDLFPVRPDTKRAEKVYLEVIRTQQPQSFVNEYRLGGKNLFFEISVFPSHVGISVFARDITERKRAEEMLRESEDRYRDLITHSNDLICTHDLDGNLLSVNKAALKVSGYSEEEALKMNLQDIIVPEYQTLFKAYLAKIRATGRARGLMIVRTKTGERRIWEYDNTLRTQGIAKPIVRGMVKDITRRKQAEEALRISEERFRSLSEAAFEAIIIHEEGVLLSANDQFFKMSGYDPHEVLGTQVILMTVAPEAREFMMKQIATGGLGPYESIGLRKDGTRFPMEIRVRQMEFKGRKVRVAAIADITERKRAEEEVKRKTEDLSLLNALNAAANRGASIQEIITLLAAQTKKMFSSLGATIYLASEDKKYLVMQNPSIPRERVDWIERLIGMKIPEVRIPMREESVYCQICREGKPKLTNAPATIQEMMAEFTENRALKKLVPTIFDFLQIHSVVTAPIIAAGELVGIVDISRDTPFTETDAERIGTIAGDLSAILQRKRTEDALSAAKSRLTNLSHRLLDAQEKERRAIARELHDEVGQILTAAKIDLQVIRRNQASNDLVHRLDDNIAVLDECLQRVRDLSLDLRPAVLDDLGLAAALSWQMERLQQRAGFLGRLTVEHISEKLEPDVETACFRIAQEALTNVARHAKAHSVEMNLRLCNQELVLSIQDDGIGFDPGEALAQAVHGKSFGVLGMQERVSLMGGKLEIKSVPQQGTSVNIRLPLRQLARKGQSRLEERK